MVPPPCPLGYTARMMMPALHFRRLLLLAVLLPAAIVLLDEWTLVNRAIQSYNLHYVDSSFDGADSPTAYAHASGRGAHWGAPDREDGAGPPAVFAPSLREPGSAQRGGASGTRAGAVPRASSVAAGGRRSPVCARTSAAPETRRRCEARHARPVPADRLATLRGHGRGDGIAGWACRRAAPQHAELCRGPSSSA